MGMFYLALAAMSAIRAKVIFEKKPQNYITANYTFRAVALNPGNHMVEFKYRPFDVYISATLSILSICILIFVAIKAVKK